MGRSLSIFQSYIFGICLLVEVFVWLVFLMVQNIRKTTGSYTLHLSCNCVRDHRDIPGIVGIKQGIETNINSKGFIVFAIELLSGKTGTGDFSLDVTVQPTD